MIEQVTAFSYGVCAVAFAVAAALLSISRSQNRYRAVLLIANLLTALWALSVFARPLLSELTGGSSILTDMLEHGRTIAWMAVLCFILFYAYKRRFDAMISWAIFGTAAVSLLILFGTDAYLSFSTAPLKTELFRYNLAARVLLTVAALLLVENLFRNSGTEARWAIKNLCFGLIVIFGYDFVLYAEAVLFGRINEQLFAARGLVNAMGAPLIILAAARAKTWPVDLHISRRMAFHSATLLGAGGYLIAMAAVSFYLSDFDNPWGFLIQTAFLLAAALALIMVLASASVQARIKDFINRNFFSYKYDYRAEWIKFIAAISDRTGNVSINERTVRALAQIVESTSGAIWVYEEEDDAYHAGALWNMGEVLPGFPANDPFVKLLRGRGGVVDLLNRQIDGQPIEDLPAPTWLRSHPKVWMAVPLIHVTGMPGFIVLGRPRSARAMTWEDFELLRTAAGQAASYVAEELTLRKLAHAKRFEDFNKQFAFVVHDIKNLAGQMTLILSNAQRHGDNPEFQKDVLATIRDSVGRMHQMLAQMRARRNIDPDGGADLAEIVRRLSVAWRLRSTRLRIDLGEAPVMVKGDAERLEAIANHIVGNAIDAAGDTGDVNVSLRIARGIEGDECVMTVRDGGAGMDPKFIEEKLFQPLDSTKSSGFGIGAYQARQLVRELGGRLDVESAPGSGTTFRIHLLLARDTTAAKSEEPSHG